MGELGSRRCLARVEVDENETLEGDALLKNFGAGLVKAFASAASTKSKPEVCAWTTPAAEITCKKAELLATGPGGGAGGLMPVLAVLGLAGAGAAYYYANFMMEPTA